MWFLNYIILICWLGSASAADTPIKGAIGFPEVEENPKFVNKANRTPVFLPAMCHENELYYPGDQADDWICDCRPGYLYHPDTDMCWPAFRQGPCATGQYLLLPKNSVSPTCYINPCKNDTLVMWNGKCETLGSMEPCGSNFPPNVLWVNSTNAVLDCVRLTKDNHVPGITRLRPTECFPGCKRCAQNKCGSV